MILHKYGRISQVLSCAVCLGVLAFGLPQTAFAQSTTDTTANAQTDGQTTDKTDGQAAGAVSTLSEFVDDTLKQMGVQAGTAIQGLSDAAETAVLAKLNQLNISTVTKSITMRGVVFDVVRYTPTGSQKPFLVLHAPKLSLANLIPAAGGTPVGGHWRTR